MHVPARPEEIRPATQCQHGINGNTAPSFPEKNANHRERFWAGAMESPSLLYWIVTHLPQGE